MVGERIRKAVLGVLAGITAVFTVAKNGHRVKPGAKEVKTEEALGARRAGAIVKASWDLPVEKNERVDYWIDFLRTKRYDDTREWVERLGYYGPMIQKKLRERGMPEDLVFLAMAESGLDPTAYSRADASGMWQFIAETGRRYGLEVSRYVDERNDPIKSTDAALDYLQDLYDHFGSWYLAAAAYNTGENRVDRVLRQRAGGQRGDESLYWRIGEFLPRETRDYVPIMLAVGHIGKDPARYGFEDLRYQEPMRFERARVKPGTRLADVARAAGVDTEEIERLNPHLIRGQTPPDRDWDVRVPPGTADAVEKALG
ncbi:MAG TPA: lytic transglycosylase domain-containing protein [Longimicrobiales bacterium]|nr:lytic transglycosylase domain-containing protein [Longimicrobiales bacterium]